VGDSCRKNLSMKVDFSIVEASQMATGVPAQQPVDSESEVTQLDSSFASNSNGTPSPHEGGPVTPTGHTGSGFGDSSGWLNLDFLEGVANMGSIDFGCNSNFGLGSSDGIIHQ
jgi:hypothetical protein